MKVNPVLPHAGPSLKQAVRNRYAFGIYCLYKKKLESDVPTCVIVGSGYAIVMPY